MTASPERRRLSALDVARGLFLVAAVGFGWLALRSRGAEIRAALAQVSPGRVLLALVIVLGGLALTALVWRGLLAGFGHRIPARPATALFFVGQLGKYIPGSVWSLGAQADMARRHRVPARTTVAVGLLFLWVHVGTAATVGALLAEAPEGWQVSPWARALVAVIGLAAVSPPVLERLAALLAVDRLRVPWRGFTAILATMAAVWAAYGAALVLVVPPVDVAAAGGAGVLLPGYVGAFAVSYVVGVLVVLAPAGVGAREGVLVALLAPTLGLPVAAASALLIRAVHTVADFAIAGLAWAAARWGPPRASSSGGSTAAAGLS
jgi:uncharacterized membrane protein YbhN (UPF0104 family)